MTSNHRFSKEQIEAIELVSKAVDLLNVEQLAMRLSRNRLNLTPLEDGFRRKVERVLRNWYAEWKKVEEEILTNLYQRVSTQKCVGGLYSDISIFERITIKKSFYDLPPDLRSLLEAGVVFSPPQQPFIDHEINFLTDIYNRVGSRNARAYGFFVPFRLRDREIIQAIRNRAVNLVGNFSNTTLERLKYRIGASFFIEGKHPTLSTVHPVTGERLTSVATDISDFFNGQLYRAKTVARTEASICMSSAEFDFNHRIGITQHGWMTAEDEKVRPSHQLNDRAVVPLGEAFPNGQIMVGVGSPEEVINCRCVSEDTEVLTERGNIPAKKIQVGDQVWSLSPQGKFCLRTVNKIYRNGTTREWLQIKTRSSNYHNTYGCESLVLTPDHKVLTPLGYVPVKRLSAGDVVYGRDERLSELGSKALWGTCIGNSVLRKMNKNGGVNLYITQGDAQKEYFDYKVEIFGGKQSSCFGHKVGDGKEALVWESDIKGGEDFKKAVLCLREKGGRMEVTKDLLVRMGGCGFAFWFMDDGSLVTEQYPKITGNWTDQEQREIIAFSDYMGWKSGIHLQENAGRKWVDWVINSCESFWEYFSVYVHPFMRHKLPELYRGEEFLSCGKPEFFRVEQRINEIMRVPVQYCRYDFEVEEFSNYIAGGVVVHNCSNYPVPIGETLNPWDGSAMSGPVSLPVEF